jgi:hypothetical protein
MLTLLQLFLQLVYFTLRETVNQIQRLLVVELSRLFELFYSSNLAWNIHLRLIHWIVIARKLSAFKSNNGWLVILMRFRLTADKGAHSCDAGCEWAKNCLVWIIEQRSLILFCFFTILSGFRKLSGIFAPLYWGDLTSDTKLQNSFDFILIFSFQKFLDLICCLFNGELQIEDLLHVVEVIDA